MPKINIEAGEFVNQFIGHSRRMKDEFIPIWSEVLSNYLLSDSVNSANTKYPLDNTSRRNSSGSLSRVQDSNSRLSKLRDPETQVAIETLLAKLMLVLFPATGNYVAASPRGREDARKARTASDLLNYSFSLPNHYRAFYVTMKDALLFGTGIMESTWDLIERPRTIRGVDVLAGQSVPESITVDNFKIYDDPRIRHIDVMDFYPDPGCDSLNDMIGAAKGFEITAATALQRVEQGLYEKEAVERALRAAADKKDANNEAWQDHIPNVSSSLSIFDTLKGHEYYGEFPGSMPDDKQRWRVITVLNGVVVRNKPWPFDNYRLPFFDITISPIAGRFYGLSPAEGIRFDQDFLDFLKSMMADAVVRTVHPPILYDRDDEIDIAKLMHWSPDVPIASEKPQSIRTLPFNTNMFNGMNYFSLIKDSIRQSTGALGAIQGLGIGVNRASATEAAQTFQNALDRPELAARYIEQECLPPLGKQLLNLYQQFLTDDSGLENRVGEQPEPVALADILTDFDISFIGARNFETQRQKLQSVDRLYQLLTVPGFANFLPMQELGAQILEGFGFHEIAQDAGTQDTVAKNLLLQQILSGAGVIGPNAGNGANPLATPGGTPAQQQGSVLPDGENIG